MSNKKVLVLETEEWKKYKATIRNDDKFQTNFNNGEIELNNSSYAVKKSVIDFNTKVLCPYCLTDNTLDKFKKDRQWYICPYCKNKLITKTLLNIIKMNPKEFAMWVFNYRLSGFFSKINFKEFNKKLYQFGISQEFWAEYKNLRGDTTKEEEQNINNDYEAMLKNTEKEYYKNEKK
jgi:hypothetical protein